MKKIIMIIICLIAIVLNTNGQNRKFFHDYDGVYYGGSGSLKVYEEYNKQEKSRREKWENAKCKYKSFIIGEWCGHISNSDTEAFFIFGDDHKMIAEINNKRIECQWYVVGTNTYRNNFEIECTYKVDTPEPFSVNRKFILTYEKIDNNIVVLSVTKHLFSTEKCNFILSKK